MRTIDSPNLAIDLGIAIVSHSPTSTICFRFPLSLTHLDGSWCSTVVWSKASCVKAVTLIAFLVWGCGTGPSMVTMAWQSTNRCLSRFFYPDPSCKSNLTSSWGSASVFLPLRWHLFVPAGPWQQGFPHALGTDSLKVNGTLRVYLPWWWLLKAQHFLSQNPLLLDRYRLPDTFLIFFKFLP